MFIDKNLLVQTFSAVIAIVLLITFYILLITDIIRGTQIFIIPMILIIIAIMLVSIFSLLYNMYSKLEVLKIEYKLKGKRDKNTKK